MDSKPTLYILDDDEQYAELLTEIASNAGWRAISEQSARTFVDSDLLANSVLVLDLIMPEMDGIEVIRALANKNLNLSLILISGFDARVLHSAQQLAEAHKLNVIANLTKPVPIHDFIQILNTIEDTSQADKKVTKKEQRITPKELERALINHELILYYQPQIKMKTGILQGVEALVRWQHPQRGLIFPDQFIELAEKNKLIDQLTSEVLTIAVEQSKQWQLNNFDTVISINVSSDNITSLSLPEKLKELTDKHQIDPGKITLELTESAVMGELTSSLDVLNRLRMKDFSLSIDDFGTGYSSLSHLYQAPFSELKIDQKFVMHMVDDTEALVIVKICIMLGQMLGMTLVAEGVEQQQHWDILQNLDCDTAQGYLIARPMPADDLVQWQKNRDLLQFIKK